MVLAVSLPTPHSPVDATIWGAEINTAINAIVAAINTNTAAITNNTSTANAAQTAANSALTAANAANATVTSNTALINQRAPLVEPTLTVAASGTTETITDPRYAETITRLTLSADCAITLPPATTGASFTLAVVQPAAGGPFVVTWPAGTRWTGATAPVLSTNANAVDVLVFLVLSTNWIGFVAGMDMR